MVEIASASDLLVTELQSPWQLSAVDARRIGESLTKNGMATIRNLLPVAAVEAMRQDALSCVRPGFDIGGFFGGSVASSVSAATVEFHHPFLLSASAVELATLPALLDVVEAYLGQRAIVHHAVFQHSLPIDRPAVDWHVDTGSHKLLNGPTRFRDHRLRMIVYLTDVASGGLSYILDSRSATDYFLSLPEGQLFPQHKVPQEGRVTANERAGTVMLFDTHGLHRPEPPRTPRLVLNVWFARNDFSAALPPVLVSLANLPERHGARSYVFRNARGFPPKLLPLGAGAQQVPAARGTLKSRLSRRIRRLLGGT